MNVFEPNYRPALNPAMMRLFHYARHWRRVSEHARYCRALAS